MTALSVIKWFLFATLAGVFICLLSCDKREDAQQDLYIPVSGDVYDTSLNKGVEGVRIFFGRRLAYDGIGNGPVYDIYDSLRTDSAGNYNYLVKYEERKDYSVCCGVPPGYSGTVYTDCKQVFWRMENGKMVPLKIDFLLVR